ncbi:MAG: hypothetical protein JWP94_1968 [Mucilaginibacter sp.]|nr:hypothetical protein [Mucilaginibacter sp.]
MIKYSVRSRQLIDIVGDIKRNKIILAPYFQRNLVWRLIHKQDFIKTILLGFPFPQIFLAKGGIDVDNFTSTSLVVDGQQRMRSIIEYLDNAFDVDDQYFEDLTRESKDNFLTYEIAIIELQMEASDPNIKSVFQRLNRTFYSLTNIEKLATEYAPSEFMLVANLLSKELRLPKEKDTHSLDPNIPEGFINWCEKRKLTNFHKLILESGVFSGYEISRKVHLMIVLNVLATIERGFFNRNIPVSILDEYKDNYPNKDEIVEKLEKVAKLYLEIGLPPGSYWLNKANFFSIIYVLYMNYEPIIQHLTASKIKSRLNQLEDSLTEEYKLAAKEAVNNKKERVLRDKYLKTLLMTKEEGVLNALYPRK